MATTPSNQNLNPLGKVFTEKVLTAPTESKALGATSDIEATDTAGNWSMISMLKGIFKNIADTENLVGTLIGAKTDTKATNGSATTSGVIAFLKGILDACLAPTPTGTNTIGAVLLKGDASTNSTSNFRKLSTADVNATAIKAGAGRLYSLQFTNTSASDRYLKLYNKASVPAPATDTALLVATYLLPAGTKLPTQLIGMDTVGKYFSTGISYAITGALADNDATTIAVNEVILNGIYA